jgi:hypothetical protein
MNRFSRTLYLAILGIALTQSACGDTPQNDAESMLDANGAAQSSAQTAACQLDGTWAFKFEIPVTWPGNAGVQGGSGVITQWARAERTHHDASSITDSIVACGSTVPDYKSQALWGGETFGTRFPDALFDNGYLPAVELSTSLTGSTVGSAYSSEVMPVQLGLAFAQPLTDKWPSSAAELLPFVVDSDHDQKPGISLTTATGHGISRPPVSYNRRRRATKFYVAVRDLVRSTGTIVNCDRFEGTASIPMLDGVPALQSRILGCEIEDGSECTKGELILSNMFQPPYRLNGEAKAVLVRVADQTSCATIRAMDF